MLAYDMSRALKIPQQRTSWAQVYVNQINYGVFVIEEETNIKWLETYYSHPKGNLYKGKVHHSSFIFILHPSPSFILHHSSFILHPSSFILYPSYFILHPYSSFILHLLSSFLRPSVHFLVLAYLFLYLGTWDATLAYLGEDPNLYKDYITVYMNGRWHNQVYHQEVGYEG